MHTGWNGTRTDDGSTDNDIDLEVVPKQIPRNWEGDAGLMERQAPFEVQILRSAKFRIGLFLLRQNHSPWKTKYDAAFNRLSWSKRDVRADLTGRTALVTGGRIKIGYQAALKLLRDGASVIVTTRFPVDAASRFQQEDDFPLWQDRLEIHSLDLRNIPSVEAFAHQLVSDQPSFDILVHNAAQTVKRPLDFYQHLLNAQCNPQALALLHSDATDPVLLETRAEYRGQLRDVDQFSPQGYLDSDDQQIDMLPLHSWLLKLGDVTTHEMLEVMLELNRKISPGPESPANDVAMIRSVYRTAK